MTNEEKSFACRLEKFRQLRYEFAGDRLIYGDQEKFGKDYAAELAVTIVFVVVVRYLKLRQGCLAYLAAIAGYTVIYRKEILNLLKSLKNAIKNKFSKEKEES